MRDRFSPSLAYLLIVAALLLLPVRATQASDDAYREAIELAVMEFRLGHWAEARAMFQRAHAIQPSARTWRGLGMTAYEMRRYVEAIGELESALADPRKPLSASLRANVKRALKLARGFVATYELRIQPDNAELQIDGEKVPVPADGVVLLNPGNHTVTVKAAGHQAVHQSLLADAGTEGTLSLSLSAVRHRRDADTAPPETNADARERPRFLAGWILAGAAAASGAVAIGYGVGTTKQGNQYERCTGDCEPIREQGQRYQRITNATAGIAGALAVGSVLGFVLEASLSKRKRHQLSVSPTTGLTYTHSF